MRWFFVSFYLESCIWPDAILRFGSDKETARMHQILCKSQKKKVRCRHWNDWISIWGRKQEPNIQFRILLWSFMVTAWKCVKTSPQTLATKELAVASQHTIPHFLFHQGISDKKQHDCRPHQPYFSLFQTEDTGCGKLTSFFIWHFIFKIQ
jgi:hypothetical protein